MPGPEALAGWTTRREGPKQAYHLILMQAPSWTYRLSGRQVGSWAGANPWSETNLEVDVGQKIGIEIRLGIRVKPRERWDREASSSRFLPESE
jgi:hypothetical protein